MRKRLRVTKDGAGFMVRITDGGRESVERIPPSPGDRLLHDRIKDLGLSESAEQLLNGEEVVVPITRHRWPLP